MWENYIKEDFLFFKPIDGRATSLDVFNTINHFLEENEVNLENSTGLCTDSMSGRNTGLSGPGKK
jgi:hypothetical protein